MQRVMVFAVVVVIVTALAAPAMAQEERNIHTEGCPEGSTSNSAGSVCTDIETGEVTAVYPRILELNPNTNPCPESGPEILYVMGEDGTCEQRPGPLAPGYTPPETVTTAPTAETVTTAATPTATVSELPRTGGVSLVLTAVLILTGSAIVFSVISGKE